MPMPTAEVVPQVHRLAQRAKDNKTLTFTNATGDNLDTLYANLHCDEDDLVLDAELAGVDDDNGKSDDDNSDYTPNDDNSEDDDDADDDDDMS